jgi:glycosyltransferase involved in cell wall biosynthesis
MLRFGEILKHDIYEKNQFATEEIFPLPVLGKLLRYGSVKKWSAYWDKFILFPRRLKELLAANHKEIDAVHIIDHSNAPYLKTLRNYSSVKKIITCHDLIAVRSALGEFPYAPKTSVSGLILQKWIKNSLSHADFYACDSRQTWGDLTRLIPLSKGKSSVLHLGTESNLSRISHKKDLSKILPFAPNATNFLLHVGSAAWYKNRKSLFRSFIHAHTSLPEYNLKLVLVGPKPQKEELDKQLSNWIKSNPNAIFSLKNLPENVLGELYKNAKALVFPSFIEGFGWPPLEAAIRGCPVITSRTGAIADLLGNYAKYVEPENQESIDQGVLQELQVPRSSQRAIKVPSNDYCRKQYFDLYEQVIAN